MLNTLSVTIGIDPNRLVALMGHASKQMIYEVYGKYTEGLEKDRQGIKEYFGDGFK
jgi:integrase